MNSTNRAAGSVAAMTSGEIDASQAAKQADDAVTELQKSLK